MKRPLQQSMQQQNNTPVKRSRITVDVLLSEERGNEDADCHVIAQQKRNDGLPVIQNVQGVTTQQSRNDSTIHSATLNVRQPGSISAEVQNTSNQGRKKSNAKAVRGITVTPAANKNKTSEQNKQQISHQQQQRPPPSQQPLNVTALNLNSAISITPTSSQRKQQEQGQFAVPQNKQNKSPINDQVERPPRPPTVDLTQDNPPQMPVVRLGRPPRALLTCQVCDKNFQNQDMLTQHLATHLTQDTPPQMPVVRRGRPPKALLTCQVCDKNFQNQDMLTQHLAIHLTQDTPPQMPVVRRGRPPKALLTCQVCDKNFQNQDMLTQHMATHRTTSKLLHRCNLCPAQYLTVNALTMHKQNYHKVEVDTVAQNEGSQLLALPVVDLKSSNVLNRLTNLGIQSYIPLSQLSAKTGGYFGLPIITIDGARNTNICNLDALGATSILSLGPLKHISKG